MNLDGSELEIVIPAGNFLADTLFDLYVPLPSDVPSATSWGYVVLVLAILIAATATLAIRTRRAVA